MIVLMGVAGAGKGTQAHMLVEKNNYSLISTGELLRARASEDQQKRMLVGELLEDDEIFALIGTELDRVPDLQKCILDGTPRSIAQADWLLAQAATGRFEITAVLNIAVDEQIVHDRLLQRGRSDDTEAGIARRFEEYRSNTLPIMQYLKEHNVPVYDINGDQDPEIVHDDILEVLESHQK